MGKGNTKQVIFAFCIAAAAIAAAFLFFGGAGNSVSVEGVIISSQGERSPLEVFPDLSREQSFIVSPQFYEPSVNLNQYMFKGTAFFLQVLEGKQREAIQLVRVYNPDNELLFCQTNWGEKERSERLEKEECISSLNAGESIAVLIQFPDNSQAQPLIELSEKRITIKPRSYADVASTCFLTLKIMYGESSREIIEASNQAVGKAGV